jgi:thiol-disulfide isomerase/thioredoxin
MLERLLIAGIVIAAALLVWCAWNRYSLRRLKASASVDPALAAVAPGTPVIVYFTTPFCAPCRTQQVPALEQIAQAYGAGVQIVRVDAAEDTATADRWGVISAPTTFVLDSHRQPRFVNRGVATAAVLGDQLRQVGI